jgi:hypothetical protein
MPWHGPQSDPSICTSHVAGWQAGTTVPSFLLFEASKFPVSAS